MQILTGDKVQTAIEIGEITAASVDDSYVHS